MATAPFDGEATEKTEADGAPVIDLNEATLKRLIAKAKKRGWITYDELNSALPQDQMSSEQIEDVMSALSDMGINIVENEDSAEEAEADEEETVEEVEVDAIGLFDGEYRAFADADVRRIWRLQRIDGGPWRIAASSRRGV